jgi:DNA-binding MarR family transcriptional regulator
MDIHNMAGHLIRRLNQISASVFQGEMKRIGFDLTSVQFAALNAIHSHPGVDQATLAGMIAYDRATIGGVTNRLETKGYLQRRVSTRDRRARVLTLTEAGEAALARLIPVVGALQGDILRGLTEQESAVFLTLAAKAAAAGNELSRAPLVHAAVKAPIKAPITD